MSATKILAELEQELSITKNLLAIVPEDKLDFKPHQKAMSLGQLAYHVAEVSGRMLAIGKDRSIQVEILVNHPIPNSKDEILERFEKSLETVKHLLTEEDTAWLHTSWKLLKGDQTLAELPMPNYVRTFVCNHLVHHRGELVAYLRQLDEKIPSIYGPTADVNPFA